MTVNSKPIRLVNERAVRLVKERAIRENRSAANALVQTVFEALGDKETQSKTAQDSAR
jgi:hypothetical protein